MRLNDALLNMTEICPVVVIYQYDLDIREPWFQLHCVNVGCCLCASGVTFYHVQASV